MNGSRYGENVRLLWHDIDFDERSVYFRSTKSHEDRYIPVDRTSTIWPALRRLQAKTLKHGGPFCMYSNNGNFQERIWKNVVALTGIEYIKPHDLRRTAITRAALAGYPTEALRKIAGHKSIATTMRYYLGVTNKDLREVVDRITRAR